ncbi:ABC transporter ATP-binding protein [Nocardioides bruguierae]|uniref:ABC transporter ATP-binding protein n=1 Tax=Nocardioides bruguierae TaxID=2945102 RepID=UPI0020220C3C|nr:ATP-binding cassette domain-containing protein [Nocardioides bruguierae]MCL8025785.1 ATP-binding cassette domain-containing protein [Nocardioides bruguierae]
MSTASGDGLHARVRVPGRVEADVRAAPGEVLAVVGPNGAGKSSLVGALAGTVPAHGPVRLRGRDVSAGPVQERRVGLVPQDGALFEHLTALENVAFGLRARGVRRGPAREAAAAWLERLGVGALAGRRPGDLSGGQARRVAVARALVTEPDLLLLDEPFAGLDVGVAATLRAELGQHLAATAAAHGTVTLLVTHDAVDALTLADRVLVLEGGRVAQEGTPADVAARPATAHVGRLVGLNVLTDAAAVRTFPPSAVTVDLTEPHGSARLRWPARLLGLTRTGDVVRLLAEVQPGHLEGEGSGGEGRGNGSTAPVVQTLLADVTPASAERLDLRPGSEMWLSVKETAVTTATMRP